MRGRGWLSSYSLGDATARPGLPLVNGFRWDTGVQLHAEWGIVDWTGAMTMGTVSNPRVDDDNDGRQIAGRVVVHATPALALGVSGARGAFLSENLAAVLPQGFDAEDGIQRAIGLDAEYSIGRFLARTETIWSRWTMPALDAPNTSYPLDATAVLVEARYRLLPGVHAAIRGERLGFSRVASTASAGNGGYGSPSIVPTSLGEWDAPVRRLEVGGGWAIRRNVVVKASWQLNHRDGGRIRRQSLGALQLLYWF